jgi:hypothetical protein
MATILTKWFTEKIHLGEMTIYNELAVVPLFCSRENGTEYITLKKALATGLTVSEVSEGGSVPELKLTNLTGKNVLILDGEELAGAKQNRVLNTSILVVAKDSLVIPVSCTEHGRWAYKSKRFEDSNVCMSPTLRSRKNQSVSSALKSSGRYVSNQGEVWNSISELRASHGTASQTGAMKVMDIIDDDLMLVTEKFLNS